MNNKITIVTASLGSGGLEKIVCNLANYYYKRGYNVSILCLMDINREPFYFIEQGVNIHYFEYGKYKNKYKYVFKWIKYLKKFFNMYKPNYVCAMTLKVGALCCLSKGRNSFRLTMREISDPKSKARNPMLDRFLFFLSKKLDGIIFQTKWEMNCYPSYLRKIGSVIPNPCDVSNVIVPYSKKNVVITSGRLFNYQKRHDVLIKAFQIVHRFHKDFQLIIYGNGPDKDYDLKLIKSLGLDDVVSIANSDPKVIDIVAASTIFVLSSDFEGLSNSLLEAICLGIPSVSTDWPGVEDVIENNTNGIIVGRNNPEKLAQGINLLIENEKMRNKISRNARNERNKYIPDLILAKYSKIIGGE